MESAPSYLLLLQERRLVVVAHAVAAACDAIPAGRIILGQDAVESAAVVPSDGTREIEAERPDLLLGADGGALRRVLADLAPESLRSPSKGRVT